MSDHQRSTSTHESAEKLATELKLLGQSLARAASQILAAAGIEEMASTIRGAAEVLKRIHDRSGDLQLISREVQDESDRAFSEFEADLRDALQSKGWRCDGQWPKFLVERALEVEIDESTHVVYVAGRKMPVASVKAIVEALAPEVAALLPKGFDARDFLEQIARAYDVARGSASTVAVFDVYREYVIAQQKSKFWRNAVEEKFVGVSVDQFRARITKALERGDIISKDGRTLHLLPPLDPRDALFVYQPAEGRFAFVGRIEFVKEQ